MSRHKGKKQKRIGKNVYFTAEELQLVKKLAQRVSLTKKGKPVSAIIRECVLSVAQNPDLDMLIFAPQSDSQLSISEILIRLKLIENIEDIMKQLKAHGVDLSVLEDQENEVKDD
ncbi:ABC-type microcin C transport system duplicated ATPase subunit YejF [Breznakia sp. PF5-3]|uniref:hypothetical protein n=1 Tax=unclassified Breznakia TaxID=2623764 RepID=UPI002405AAB3|nr:MULTISPECIES: hypothetical protein [unclassified Breznakia]MDF9825205.1 ABC-type microcin C transport system duplicated ATPase subunit YejF [Breznakia sp. PM6-1]MDF9836063.1 ABC-type microcin C transport system duplicated ATPase subunit YejF [Breznakia sp. PF5-3]MDF9838879.1 ABC-type microcin C transport system duplicated ATPase subunit YejF [Breznakia sp. PFB2-8]MDF9860905.1 ABC-type microcin C transport system duplicated ATPase subunit YejF [Breznakia sp. PH5-24]